MTRITRAALALSLATAPMSAMAITTDGNLSVTTTISVSCSAPSPSGTLNLPFDSSVALDSQNLAVSPVTVSVNCLGNPTVNHVDFGNGQNRDTDRDEDGVRYMFKASGTSSNAAHYLGYKLYAKAGTESNSATIAADTEILEEGSASNGNRLTLGGSSSSYQVTGKVYETETRTGAFGVATDSASGGKVPGGSYTDTVVMTVDYN